MYQQQDSLTWHLFLQDPSGPHPWLPCFPYSHLLSVPLEVTTNQISNTENWFTILEVTVFLKDSKLKNKWENMSRRATWLPHLCNSCLPDDWTTNWAGIAVILNPSKHHLFNWGSLLTQHYIQVPPPFNICFNKLCPARD